MLKKAGIVVAASAAALLAVSPLAFAGEGHHGHEGGSDTDNVQLNSVDSGSHSSGLIAVGDVNALNNLNVCPAIPVGVGVGDILGILSPGTAAVTPTAGDIDCSNDNSVDQDNDDNS